MTRRTALKLETLADRVVPAASALDLTFGDGGKVFTAFGSSDSAQGVAVQPDGKIVAAGYANVGGNNFFAVARYNTDGSLDTSFGGTGKVTTAVGSADSNAYGVALQADGKIVAAGSAQVGSVAGFALVRYNADGSLDASFDGDGKVTTPLGGSAAEAYHLAVQADGKIVAAGPSFTGGESDFAVARYNADGSLDTGFDADGTVVTVVGPGNDYAHGVAVQADGKVVVVGSSYNGTDEDFAVVRYNVDGSLDASFGGDGTVTTPVGASSDAALAVAVQADGKIVTSGLAYVFDPAADGGGTTDFALVRYHADGTLDASFGGDGTVITVIGQGDNVAYGLAVQADGKIVAAGHASLGLNNAFAVARYAADGTLDPTLGGTGTLTGNLGPNSIGEGVAVQADGRIVVAGTTDDHFSLARFRAATLTLTPGGSPADYVEGGALAVAAGLTVVNDPATLAGATVHIGNYARRQDTLQFTPQAGITAAFDAARGVLTFTGTASLAAYQTLLRSLTFVNTSHQPSELPRTVTITVNDGQPTDNLASVAYTFEVFARNDAPDLLADAELAPVLQGSAGHAGQKVVALFGGVFADPDAPSALAGVAVVGNPLIAAQGRWQYSTDNAANWFDVAAVADDATALALSSATRLRFLPAAAFTGRPAPLTVRALDDTFAGPFTAGATRQATDAAANGGETAVSAATALVETTVFPAGGGGPANAAPTLAGVPTSANINEGVLRTFTAAGTDPEGAPLTYALLDAPDWASIHPTTGVFTWTPTEAQGPDVYAFGVTVSDGTATTTKIVTLNVREVNTPPVLDGVPASVTTPGAPVAFIASATDADDVQGEGNVLTYALVGAPVGAAIDPDTGAFSWTPDAGTAPGAYTFKVRVFDHGVPAKAATRAVTVTVAPAAVVDGDLLISGTAGADTITVNLSRDGTLLVVTANKEVVGSYPVDQVTGRIVVRGLAGADRVTLSAALTVPADLYGGDGNDILTGGAGDDRLYGEAGNDLLAGAKGNDLLLGGDDEDKLTDAAGFNVFVGGAGFDSLTGGAGGELLIAGEYDADLTGLTDLLTAWANPALTYSQKVFAQKPTVTAAAADDGGAKDAVSGGAGADWFVVSLPDAVTGLDLKLPEEKTTV